MHSTRVGLPFGRGLAVSRFGMTPFALHQDGRKGLEHRESAAGQQFLFQARWQQRRD